MIKDDFEREHLKEKMYLVGKRLEEEEELEKELAKERPQARISLKEEEESETLKRTNHEINDSTLPF